MHSGIGNFTMGLSLASDENVLRGVRAFPPRFRGKLFVINPRSHLQPRRCQIPCDNFPISTPKWCENPHLTISVLHTTQINDSDARVYPRDVSVLNRLFYKLHFIELNVISCSRFCLSFSSEDEPADCIK